MRAELAIGVCLALVPACRNAARSGSSAPSERPRSVQPPEASSNMNYHLLDEQIPLEAPGLLAYLSARLDAPGGLLHGIQTASVIAHGRVAKFQVVPLKVGDAAKSDASIAPYMDDTGSIYAQVLEVEVRESLLGPAGALTVAWPQPLVMSTGGPPLPPVGKEIVIITATGTSEIAREIARRVSGALGVDPTRLPIFMPPELFAELRWRRDALARSKEEQLAEGLAHLGAAGRRAAPAVDVLSRFHGKELDVLARWVQSAEGSGALLGRALLWRAGNRDAATQGLDVAMVPSSWLEAVGVSVAEADGVRLGILGPSRNLPLL